MYHKLYFFLPRMIRMHPFLYFLELRRAGQIAYYAQQAHSKVCRGNHHFERWRSDARLLNTTGTS